MAQFIKFDNSEDAFYPQNDTTELLYEIEERYQASLDFIRVIDEIEQGDMQRSETWEQFAIIEAELSTNDAFLPYHEPLFGGSSTSGPAGSALVLVEYTRSDNNANMARRSFNASCQHHRCKRRKFHNRSQ